MFLKSLEIQGFKSFADKVVFDFSSGVTAIVGPNGSGKSNVVDAIRWVLGEQSARTLRGAKMEDVIFSGSVDRKPVGMARVTMRLDNSQRLFALDSDEVEVTRTLYRSGESNYMLNKSNCRLKDIQELFMDTGLGKDGFSVIGQGKIEEILTLHAEERRGLIEEAAGISKYKYRKREAERKLASTQDDMTRLDDILFEQEKRIQPLSIQAEKVRQYRALKGEEDALHLAHLTRGYLAEKEGLDALRTQADADRQAADAAQAELAALERTLEEGRAALSAQRQAFEEAQAAYTATLRESQEAQNARDLLEERQRHNRQRLDALAESSASQREKRAAQEAEASALEAQLVELKAKTAQAHGAVQDTETALHTLEARIAAHKSTIDEKQAEQFEALSQQSAANNDITRLTQSMSGDEARQARLHSRLDGLMAQQAALDAELKEAEQRHEALAEDAAALIGEGQALGAQIDAEQKALREAQARQQSVNQAQMQAESRLQTLEEFEASGEGYYQGVQAVLRAKKEGHLDGLEGSILQLLEIPTDYLAAIENALGGAAQNIVAASDRDAQTAIAWLKREKRGRVTFMPLNLVKGKRQQVNFDDAAVIGLALDLVKYDAKYEPVMAQLLGRVWVLKDLASATRLAKRTGSKYRFVTLDGDILSPGGSMTGGHAKKQSSIVYRKHEMGMLRERIERLRADGDKLAGDVAGHQAALDTLESTQAEKREAYSALQLQMKECKVVLEQLGAQDKRLGRELELERLNHEELSAQREDMSAQLEQAQAAAAAIAEGLVAIEDALQSARTALSDEEGERETLHKELQTLLVDKATADEQEQAVRQQLKSCRSDIEQLTRDSQAAEAQRRQFEDEADALAKALDEKNAAIGALAEAFSTSEAQLAALKEEIASAERARSAQETALAKGRQQNDALWRAANGSALKLERAEDKQARLVEQLLADFDYTPAQAIEATDFELDLTNAATRLKTLRTKIAQLGEINFTALEEYEQVCAQVDFMRTQMDDLNQAREKLETIIREMEATMAARFKDAYNRVNEQFSKIFTVMFGGGAARLELSMPGQYLETGIEIIAQPPGKKERVLTLLSGGERALTAAALLFALLEVRPSPFVILDEIEAALDEANVERFADFIIQYANRTQFIIISHRKGTMEAASVLYGVTMDKNGVSKQVSVRLSDFND